MNLRWGIFNKLAHVTIFQSPQTVICSSGISYVAHFQEKVIFSRCCKHGSDSEETTRVGFWSPMDGRYTPKPFRVEEPNLILNYMTIWLWEYWIVRKYIDVYISLQCHAALLCGKFFLHLRSSLNETWWFSDKYARTIILVVLSTSGGSQRPLLSGETHCVCPRAVEMMNDININHFLVFRSVNKCY